jgi:FkbM family methyltransferase
MHYKFIDIGCGNTNVSVDQFGLNVNGLLVEPIKEFCEILPSSNTVKVECAAVLDYDGDVEINLTDVEMSNIKYFPIVALNTEVRARRLSKNNKIFGTESIILRGGEHTHKRKVTCMRLDTLLEKFNIDSVDQFKIDVEGADHVILKQLIDLMECGHFKVNKRIIFEYNYLSNKPELDRLAKIIADKFQFAYEFQKVGWNEDIVMTKIEK